MTRFARTLLAVAALATAALLATSAVAPAPAVAEPTLPPPIAVDPLACSAVGSYSRLVGGVPYTFWLVTEEVSGAFTYRRYWHVESAGRYAGSYVVTCGAGSHQLVSYVINPWKWRADLCWQHVFAEQQQSAVIWYTPVGEKASLVEEAGQWRLSRFVYWRLEKEEQNLRTYLESVVAVFC